MDSLITAAAPALAAGDPLGALKRVALREEAPALALRGIAMAQLGDLVRAKALLRGAARPRCERGGGPGAEGGLRRALSGRTRRAGGGHSRADGEVESAFLVLNTQAARLIARGEERLLYVRPSATCFPMSSGHLPKGPPGWPI